MNTIAVIWDFDKTLIDGYMQQPIFEHYGVDAGAFWEEVNRLPQAIYESQGVRVNPDTVYLNCFLREAQVGGQFEGLNNQMLRDFGKRMKFYPGVEALFRQLYQLHERHPEWEEYHIQVENYIVSTGFAEIIRGSRIAIHTKAIWGCELIESSTIPPVLAEIGYTIDHTTKTRAIFEINKGIFSQHEQGIDVNTKVPDEQRRVQRKHMIYIADGPSDVPAFSVVQSGGGRTMAVYPAGNKNAFFQVNQLREDGRVDMVAEADYRESSMAFMWIMQTIEKMAQDIIEDTQYRYRQSIGRSPKHIHD